MIYCMMLVIFYIIMYCLSTIAFLYNILLFYDIYFRFILWTFNYFHYIIFHFSPFFFIFFVIFCSFCIRTILSVWNIYTSVHSSNTIQNNPSNLFFGSIVTEPSPSNNISILWSFRNSSKLSNRVNTEISKSKSLLFFKNSINRVAYMKSES